MRFVSLFAGSGGFDLGLERAGHECVLQVELDAYRAQILHRHWPAVPLVRDVRDVRAGVPLRRGDADLICGGFPCRDLSVVGRRRGLEAEESADGSGLFFEMCRVADDLLRPGGWVLIENVPGLLSSAGGRDFAVSYGRWATSGFTTSPGECWTAVCTESLSPAGESSSLRDVLQDPPPDEFSLTVRSARGILKRARTRGRALPAGLGAAIQGWLGSSTGGKSPAP